MQRILKQVFTTLVLLGFLPIGCSTSEPEPAEIEQAREDHIEMTQRELQGDPNAEVKFEGEQ